MPSVKNTYRSPAPSGIVCSSSSRSNISPLSSFRPTTIPLGARMRARARHDSPQTRRDLCVRVLRRRARHVNQRRVAGARVGHRARVEIDDRVRHRDEGPGIEVLGDDAVGGDQERARRRMNRAQRQHQPLELRHVKRRRGPLARHVGDQDADAMIVERQEVVVVAAHFARRNTERRRRQSRHHQRPLRQQRHLNLVRDAELLFEPLLFRRLAQQTFDARRHRVERLGQLAELIARLDRRSCA